MNLCLSLVLFRANPSRLSAKRGEPTRVFVAVMIVAATVGLLILKMAAPEPSAPSLPGSPLGPMPPDFDFDKF